MQDSNKLQYFYANHPAVLEERDDVEHLELLQKKLQVAEAWDMFSESFAFVDLTVVLDSMKTNAYQTMVGQEEEERKQHPIYRSDAWLKGRLSVLAEIKHHISLQMESVQPLLDEISEEQEKPAEE